MQGNTMIHRQWSTSVFLGIGAGAGVAALVNWLGLAALRAGSWQTLSLVSVAALAAAVITELRRLRELYAEARLMEVFNQIAAREIARQEKRRKEWWARNLSPALALARTEQHQRYDFTTR